MNHKYKLRWIFMMVRELYAYRLGIYIPVIIIFLHKLVSILFMPMTICGALRISQRKIVTICSKYSCMFMAIALVQYGNSFIGFADPPRRPIPSPVNPKKQPHQDKLPKLEVSIQQSPQTGVFVDTILGTPITFIPPGAGIDLSMASYASHNRAIYPSDSHDVRITPKGNGYVDFTVVNKNGTAPLNAIFQIILPMNIILEPSPDHKSFFFTTVDDEYVKVVSAVGNFLARDGTGRSIPIQGLIAGQTADATNLMLRIALSPQRVRYPITSSMSYVTFFEPIKAKVPPPPPKKPPKGGNHNPPSSPALPGSPGEPGDNAPPVSTTPKRPPAGPPPGPGTPRLGSK